MAINYPKTIVMLRSKLNLSQEEFGKLIGASLVSVSRWERGEFEPTKIVKVRIDELLKKHHIETSEVNE